jgi:Mn-dependent DtxR family transcriptional regulator
MHDATEEYLETILEIEEEGIVPIRARLVERLGLSAAAVSEQVNRLVEQGYAELGDDRTLRLTESGRALAISIVRRHRLAERLLLDVIGLEWEKVHREADRWEHAISADVEAKLVELLGDPATCPDQREGRDGRRRPRAAGRGAPDPGFGGRGRARRPRRRGRRDRRRGADGAGRAGQAHVRVAPLRAHSDCPMSGWAAAGPHLHSRPESARIH